jgi:DNA repair protein RecO (recombination protein O)
MPEFVCNSRVRAETVPDICTAFKLTGFFFTRHVWEPRGQQQPESRSGFISALNRAA